MRVAAFSLAAVLTAACATSLPTREAGLAPPPLTARWFDPTGRGLRFILSEPAYVAIFDITPGSGAALIYPAPSARQYERAGLVTPLVSHFVPGFSAYVPSIIQSYHSGPRFLLLIASRSPLRLEGLYTAGGMRRRIGSAHFASYFGHRTLEHVLDSVLPLQADPDWAVDVLTIWPDLPPLRFVRQYRVLVCGDRTAIIVPITYVGSCSRDRSLSVASAPTSRGVARPMRDNERRAPAGSRPRAPRPVDDGTVDRPIGRERPTPEARPASEREGRPRPSAEPRGERAREAPAREPAREPTRETPTPRNVEQPSTPNPRAPR